MGRDEITAKWARKTSQEILGAKVNKQINDCLDAVERAVKSNKLSVDVSMYVDDLTLSELGTRGFTVTKHADYDQRDPDYITIKW